MEKAGANSDSQREELERLRAEARRLKERVRELEDELRDVRPRRRYLFATSPDGIAITDMDHRLVDCNRSYLKLLGYDSVEDLAGVAQQDLTPPEYRDMERYVIETQTMPQGWCHEYEKEYLRRDGGRVPVSVRAWLRRDGNGEPDGMCLVARDISERKAAEKALLAAQRSLEKSVRERTDQLLAANQRLHDEISERRDMEARLAEAAERFKRYFDQSPLGAAVVGLDFSFLRVNAEFCRITGYSSDELLGMGFPDITHPDDVARDMAECRRAVAGEINQYEMDKRYIRKDGSHIWVRLWVGVVHDVNRAPLYFLPLVQDISRIKKAEEDLRFSRHTAQALLDAISESTMLVDANGLIIAANQTAARRLGASLDKIIGCQATSLVEPEVAERRREFGLRALETGQAVRFEDRRGDRIIDNTYQPVKDDQGNVTHLAMFAADVTERRLAEDLLKRHRDELENLVQDRTRELEASNRTLKNQAVRLEQMNSALRVLLEQREHDKQDYESQVNANLNNLVMPYLEQVVQSRIPDDYKALLEIAISNLRDLVTSFSATLLSLADALTPREIQVANLVREGKTNKEIAGILGVSPRAVEFHRSNLRCKLDLVHRNINLRSYLLSLSNNR